MKEFSGGSSKITCIPNGVHVPRQAPANPGRGPLRLIYVGAMDHYYKGTLHLKGIADWLRTMGIQFTLDLVGGGKDYGQLRTVMADHERGGNVRFHGALPPKEATTLLAASDALLMPSYHEGLPIVLLEAMARGVVPICSRIVGSTDYVIHGPEEGFLIEPGDEKGYADAAARLTDRARLARMSRATWKAAFERHSAQRMTDGYLSLIESNLRVRGAGPPGKSGAVLKSALGDLPTLPKFAVRPARRLLRALGMMAKPVPGPLFPKEQGEG